MKKILTIILLIFLYQVYAQNNRKIDRIKSLKITFISDKLELTTDEAQRFWPFYNAFDSKQVELRTQKRLLNFRIQESNRLNLSEKELANLLADSENLEVEFQNNRKKLVKDLQGVIPTQKILRLKQLEEEFRKNLLEQIQKRSDKKR